MSTLKLIVTDPGVRAEEMLQRATNAVLDAAAALRDWEEQTGAVDRHGDGTLFSDMVADDALNGDTAVVLDNFRSALARRKAAGS